MLTEAREMEESLIALKVNFKVPKFSVIMILGIVCRAHK